jgi:uncharacterized membrane protein
MTILSYPIYELFLYFMFYSFLGWLMETCYCSIMEHKWVARGFLFGPICPIYGGGVLIMILFFTPLKGNLVLFYATAVVLMTSWEYLVGWVLETTTHVKYWDYSNYKFNLKGRVCLWVALVWGVLSYIIIFLVHPPIEALYQRMPHWLVYTLCGTLGTLLLADTVLTIRQLALVSRLVVSANNARAELQIQMSLGKAELGDKLDETTEALRIKYRDQLDRLERQSRRFRRNYTHMSINSRYSVTMEDLRAAGALAKEELMRRKAERNAARGRQ